MFDHGPAKEEPIRTPSEFLRKQRASLLNRLAIHAIIGGIAPPSESRPKVVLKPIRVNEERFGKASPAIAQPLLAGNRGKLSRKKRKALNVKHFAQEAKLPEYCDEHTT